MAADNTALGHRFTDPQLLAQALTHRSAARINNERLEFLGDALVNLIVAEAIYEQHPRASEGEMTRRRAALVNGAALAQIAKAQDLGQRLHLGSGELKTGGFRRESILADAFEAIVAAIYLDGGWNACRDIVRGLFKDAVAAESEGAGKDAKTLLQELLQGRGLPVPVYELVASEGEDHAKVFEVACSVEALAVRTVAHGSSRRSAEQSAAEQALTEVRSIRKK